MTPWTATHQASLSFSISQSLLRLMFIELVVLAIHLILCRPLLLLPSIFPSIRVFYNELALHIRWPKYQSFNFISSPDNEYSGLISCRIGRLISLLSKGLSRVFSSTRIQKIKRLFLPCSAFFMAQLSHLYITGKTIALKK